MADLLDRSAVEAGLPQRGHESVDDRLRIILGARRHLLGADLAVVAQQHDVREGAADIHPNPVVFHEATALPGDGNGSCRCTAGTSRQPRRARMFARLRSVAAASNCQARVSMTTP